MTGTRNRLRRNRFTLPIFVIEIFDQQPDGRANRFAVHDAARNLRGIAFNFHPRARAVSGLTAQQIAIDLFKRNGQTRRQALDNASERGPVRFTRS
ncbi:MAG: hypothetical protein HDKAJFGB_02550 [Anaerolineae bacterium]|nr:hypothetical protein [Anaerolineae bacterium]